MAFGPTWLLLGLEFELAADISGSVVSPTWQDIGKLVAIAVIRICKFFDFLRDGQEAPSDRLIGPREFARTNRGSRTIAPAFPPQMTRIEHRRRGRLGRSPRMALGLCASLAGTGLRTTPRMTARLGHG